MKLTKRFFCFISLCFFPLFHCGNLFTEGYDSLTKGSTAGVTINPSTTKVSVNGTTQLTATVSPPDAIVQTVNWNSSDSSLATVDLSGLVTGKMAGTVTITATSTDDPTKSSGCTVTIIAIPTSSLYRYRNVGLGHYYTTNFAEFGFFSASGYYMEHIQCNVYSTQVSGTTPFYHYFNGTDNFYTTNWNELGDNSGYTYQKITCYVYSTQVSGTTPLYRYCTSDGYHFYTDDWLELGDGENTQWTYEGVACYVFP